MYECDKCRIKIESEWGIIWIRNDSGRCALCIDCYNKTSATKGVTMTKTKKLVKAEANLKEELGNAFLAYAKVNEISLDDMMATLIGLLDFICTQCNSKFEIKINGKAVEFIKEQK